MDMTGEKVHGNSRARGLDRHAPGDLALVQAFLNTRWDLNRGHRETLDSPAALAVWLRRNDLLRAGAGASQPDLERALAMREGLRALAFANGEQPFDPSALEAMHALSQDLPIEIQLDPARPRFLTDAAAGVGGGLAMLVAITARAMLDGSWQRLKACPGRHCGWAFYDYSRNRSARWCSMNLCGDREKSRTYYRRKASGVDV